MNRPEPQMAGQKTRAAELAPSLKAASETLRGLSTEERLVRGRRDDQVEIPLGVVLSGVLAFERTLADGRRALTELFHEGDLIEGAGSKGAGRLVALSEAVVLTLDPEAFDRGAAAGVAEVEALLLHQREQSSRLRDHAVDLAVKTPVERMASTLFELLDWPGVRGDDGATLRLPLLRRDIADYAGMKPETVSRSLRRLFDAGLIRKSSDDPGAVVVIDEASLRRVANGGAPRGAVR